MEAEYLITMIGLYGFNNTTNKGLVTVLRHEARLLILWFKKPRSHGVYTDLQAGKKIP